MPSFPAGAPSSPELKSQSKHILKDPDITRITCAQGSWKPEGGGQPEISEERRVLFVHLWVRGRLSIAPSNSPHASLATAPARPSDPGGAIRSTPVDPQAQPPEMVTAGSPTSMGRALLAQWQWHMEGSLPWQALHWPPASCALPFSDGGGKCGGPQIPLGTCCGSHFLSMACGGRLLLSLPA